jgi:hypothetical protein
MSYIVEHMVGGKKVRQTFAYKYWRALWPALKNYDVVRVFRERVYRTPSLRARKSKPRG